MASTEGCADGPQTREQNAGLAFANVSLDVGTSKATTRRVLANVSGHVKPGRLLAVMGPSGSGKTSLLSALAGQLPKRRSQRLMGHCKRDVSQIAFVPQDARFFSNLTVRETIELVAQLDGLQGQEMHKEVQRSIRQLGLSECADTLVGGNTGGIHVPGISGGERKRLAIACETVGSLGDLSGVVVIADEPTTGLDSFQADKVVEKLRDMAHSSNASVMCSLHQPRSTAFHRVDDLMILSSGGCVCYYGEARNALEYFTKRVGKECPSNHNPAEFMIDLVSLDTSSKTDEAASKERVTMLQQRWHEHAKETSVEQAVREILSASSSNEQKVKKSSHNNRRAKPGPFRVFRLLFQRAAKQTSRDSWVNVVRAASSALLGLAFGMCHLRIGRGQRSIQARAAVLLQMCINSGMISMVKSLNGFPHERAVVAKEIARDQAKNKEGGGGKGGYGIGPYFLSKLCVEVPLDAIFPAIYGAITAPLCGLNPAGRLAMIGTIALQSASASSLGMSIGAISNNVETALAVGPCIMVLNIMLGDTGGFLAELPKALRPLSKFSVIKWAMEGCVVAEFRNSSFECDTENMPEVQAGKTEAERRARARAAQEMCLRDGSEVLKRFNLGDQTIQSAFRGQALILLGNIAFTYCVLKLKGAGEAREPMNPALPEEEQKKTEQDGL